MKKIVLIVISACMMSITASAATYQPWPQAGLPGMPPGSYSQTCSSCSVDANNTLLCACADRSGIPRNTFLPNARFCGWVDNVDGQLTCAQGQQQKPYRRHKYSRHNTVNIPAGPIWNQSNAQQVCPSLCQNNRGTWTGQWNTTAPGQTSVCQCRLY